MDPISAIFASYLDLVATTISSRMTDIMGTEIQTVTVEQHLSSFTILASLALLLPDPGWSPTAIKECINQ